MTDFRLTITFTGMCLFLRDQKAVHVVFPEGHGGPHRHFCRVFVDKAAHLPSSDPSTGPFEGFDLEQVSMDFARYASDGGAAILPAEICDVASKTMTPGKAFPDRLRGNNPHTDPTKGRINARLTLYGGVLSACAPATWRFPKEGKGVRLTNQVRWSRVVSSGSGLLDLVLEPFTPGGPVPTYASLHPHAHEVEMHVFNVTDDDMPPNGPVGGGIGNVAKHFDVYYHLLEEIGDQPTLEANHTQKPCFVHPEHQSTEWETRGATPQDCLTGGGGI